MTPFPSGASALTTILVVSDVERSKRWYVDVLGAELFREYEGTSAVLSLLGNWLLLVTGGDPTADKPTVSMAAPADPNRVDHAFTIRVDDCRGSYEDLRARGAAFLTSPHDFGREVRCFFRDPDGHVFEISEAVG